MGNYSKLIAAIVGPVVGFAVTTFGLPAEWAGEGMTTALVTIISAIAVFFAPANKPS